MADQPPNPQNRMKLRDGRYLAYKERGIPKDDAKFTIVLVHGFGSSKDMNFNVSQEFVEETGIYFVLYDRAGYGESDPNPKRSLKSEASDVQELADGLQIGSRFYLIGISMGSYTVWSCLKHIPQR
ncbi:BnaCnng78730D [Brassica napus]|uniref:BnaCnng78730D protein n=4 Tax=Brassica TaxID=3705 RepID=A0A078K173_BRANA|nr:BnaCnng78730D [Brassica napus]